MASDVILQAIAETVLLVILGIAVALTPWK